MPVNDEVDECTHDNLESSLAGYDREAVDVDAAKWVEQAPSPEPDPDESATFELYEDDIGQWRWRLVDRNGGVVADCDTGYRDRDTAREAATAFRDKIETAPVVASESP